MRPPALSAPARVTAAGLGGFLAIGAVLPVLPRYVKGPVGGDELAAGIVFGIFAASALLSRPVAGRLADRHGPRAVLAGGLLLASAAGALLFLPFGVPSLLVARLVVGAAEGAIAVGGTTLAIELAPEHRRGRAIGMFGLAFWVGLGLGAVVGETLFQLGGYEVVWAFATLAPVASVSLARSLPAPGPARRAGPRLRATAKGSPVRQPWLPPRAALGPGVLLALGGYGYAAITGFAVLHLDAAHVGGGGAVLAVFALFAVGVRLVAPDATDRLGGRRAALLALAAQSTGLAVLAPASALVPALLGAAVAGLGTSLLFPSLALLVLERTEPSRRASAIGGFSAFLDLGVALSGPATGALARAAGYGVAFGVAAMLGVAAVAGLLLWSRRRDGPGLTVEAATSSVQNRAQVGNLRQAGSGREAQMQDQPFILDAVAHAYHFGEDNYAHQAHASAITDLAYSLIAADATHWMPREAYCRDWSVEEMAWLLFTETATDVAVFHPTPINAYKDGLISVEKAAEARRRWPDRFLAYATVDPLAGQEALEELERQAELLRPIGLKLYPTSWRAGGYPQGWRMDDPEVAFPLYEKARSLGLRSVAVHKSVPLGPVPMDPFKPGDIDAAAGAFPDLAFEIVHGGVAFTEETAWMLARFPNVYINMETLNIILALNPRRFAEIMATLLSVGGEAVIPRFLWGSGAMAQHPKLGLDAFLRFQMPEDLLSAGGVFGEVPQLTDEHKRKMLGGNYADLHDLDLAALGAAIADDEFARRRREQGHDAPRPWSTTRAHEFGDWSVHPEPAAAPVPAG